MERLALEARSVSKRYDSRTVLECVDLIVERGQLHGLLGPNGAGKTTLMRVLLGLVRRDAGDVSLLGTTLDFQPHPLAEGVAGFVETPAFYPYLSGRKNLALLARLDGQPLRQARQQIETVLEDVGLTARADDTVAGYSAGMRQRLGFAAALLRRPRLLFLDEPTSSLDPAGARQLRALAQRLAADGVAVVMSSHLMTEVEELCDTLTVIDSGHVVFAGTIDDLRNRLPAEVHALRTSDDTAAVDLALRRPGLRIVRRDHGCLEVSADTDTLDAYVIALGSAGIAVRALVRRERSLESLYFHLIEANQHDRSTARMAS
jgi:ABC-2 type transport system ATP-binding protein